MIVSLILALYSYACSQQKMPNITAKDYSEPLRMAISPYQDTAFLTTVKDLDLEKKYDTKVRVINTTMGRHYSNHC